MSEGRELRIEDCRIQIGRNNMGMIMFRCMTHSNCDEKKSIGERLSPICFERLEGLLLKVLQKEVGVKDE